MTAINILPEPDAIHLFTDTQVSIEGFGSFAQVSKCTPLPHLQAAIATRGRLDLLAIITEIACFGCGSPRSLKTSFAWQLKAIIRGSQLAPDKRRALETPFDIFVVGWLDDAPYAYALSNHDLHGPPAWKVQDLPDGYSSPVPNDARLFEKLRSATDRVRVIPEIVAAQAQVEPTIIGGSIQQTTVSATGIHTKIIGKIPKA